jgi:hypothetical protein
MGGTEGILWPKFEALMDFCGNDAPLYWMLHKRGYDLTSVRKTENEYQQRIRHLEEQNKYLLSALRGNT